MVRDMKIRKFQKDNLDDLFAVIRNYPSGMECLRRFASEQLMGADVSFFTDVEGKGGSKFSLGTFWRDLITEE